MSRPLRLEFAGALYHVTARGDRREAIFEDDADREELLGVLAQALARFDAGCLAYCLMPNHYHLVIETRRANLSRLMRQVNGVYTQRYNRRHGKVGHLFQGRFKAIVVDREAYLQEVCRYVELNPVRARLVKRPQEWRWGSYRAHVGLSAAPAWLDCGQLLGLFAGTGGAGRRRYAEFVAQGRGVRLWEQALRGQIYLGDEAFMRRLQSRGAARADSREIPRAQRRSRPRELAHYVLRSADRDAGIARAYREGGYTQSAIARAAGLSVSRVSRIIGAHEARNKT
ncbi:MAG: transposase [Burkholderiales bacterium]|nr:transposase [Burkholderiales bacterium]